MTDQIKEPHCNDFLKGRGNRGKFHWGNKFCRAIIRKHRETYARCSKKEKKEISKSIYDGIISLNPPGRFLKQDNATKLWCDIGEKESLSTIRQGLREGATELLTKNGTTEGGDGVEAEDRIDILKLAEQNQKQQQQQQILLQATAPAVIRDGSWQHHSHMDEDRINILKNNQETLLEQIELHDLSPGTMTTLTKGNVITMATNNSSRFDMNIETIPLNGDGEKIETDFMACASRAPRTQFAATFKDKIINGFSNYARKPSLLSTEDLLEDYDEMEIEIDAPLCARTVSNYTSGEMSLDTIEDYDEAEIDIDTPLCPRTVFAATKHNNGSGFSNLYE